MEHDPDRWAPPRLSTRAFAIWRRNFLVWRKMAIPAILGNLADPMIYLFALGYGFGSMLPQQPSALGGMSYIAFLAAGTVCSSTMNAASFETLYSAFSRMHVQKTWDAILNAPVTLDDVMTGELLWAASKASLSGLAILVVSAALGLTTSPMALWTIPVIFLTGLAFSALGLIVTALAPSYDFFMYYFTLFVTPMLLLSGVFFPLEQLPATLQRIAGALPLAHSVYLVRPLMSGALPDTIVWHVLSLGVTTAVAYWVAVILIRRRLLK